MRDLLQAGAHFGHQTRYWNPKMGEYIFGARNKIHIINLEHTVPAFNEALDLVRGLAANKNKVLFVGTFTAGGLQVALEKGEMSIVQEGRNRKFIVGVEQITFNGAYAAEQGKDVLYITERCVFKMTDAGLELIEIAPGIDLKNDILNQMEFEPIINDVKLMDSRLFLDKRMGLRADMLNMNMANRLYHDEKNNIVFANLSGIELETEEDLEAFRQPFEEFLSSLGQKVNLISNHDGMSIAPRLAGKWADLLSRLESDFYLTACRYSTNPFLRQKLGQDLKKRAIAPHIFETQKEAANYLASTQGS